MRLLCSVLLAALTAFALSGQATADDCTAECMQVGHSPFATACVLTIPSGCTYASWSCSPLSSHTVAVLFVESTDYYFTPTADTTNSLNRCTLEEKVGNIGGNLQLASSSVHLIGNHLYHAHWTGKRWVFNASNQIPTPTPTRTPTPTPTKRPTPTATKTATPTPSKTTTPTTIQSRTPVATPTGIVTVVKIVRGNQGPWSFSNTVNTGEQYGLVFRDHSPPTVISSADGLSFVAGDTITVTYLSGTASQGSCCALADANGNLGWPANDALDSNGHAAYPSYFMPHSDYPIYVMTLVGSFTDAKGSIVGTPFPVRDGPKRLTVPNGATQLQLGANDDEYVNNPGFWNISITGKAR